MKDFSFPFNFQSVPEALRILNEMRTAPFSLTEKHLESWWEAGEIELCFDWEDTWKSFLDPDDPRDTGTGEGYLAANFGLVVPRYQDLRELWLLDFPEPDPTPVLAVKPYGTGECFEFKRVPHGCGWNCGLGYGRGCDYDTKHWKSLQAYLGMSSLVLPYAEAEKIYRKVRKVDEPQTQKPTERISSKVYAQIVAGFKAIGLTDDDLKDKSIAEIIQHAAGKGLTITAQDNKTLAGWLEKGGVQRNRK